MKQRKKSVWYFLREIAIVSIGILIALFLNNWKENRTNQQYLEKAMQTIRLELEESRKDVASVVERQENTMDSIEMYLEDESQTLLELISRSGGVQYPLINNIGLRFFIANKAELLDYQLITKMAEIERSSDLLAQKFDKLMDYAYRAMKKSDAGSKEMFAIHLSNVLDSEYRLLELFEEFTDHRRKDL